VVPTPYISVAPLDGLIVVRELPNETEAAHRPIGEQLPLGCITKLVCADSLFALDCDTCPSVPNTTDSVAPPSARYFHGLLRLRHRQRNHEDKRDGWSEHILTHAYLSL
jgi:hypothetical protein